MANNHAMRKLFLKLYLKMFVTMLLLAAIGVLAFYMLSQRQQQVYLQQHSSLLITQIQAYFDDLIDEKYQAQGRTLTREEISNELIIFQQFSSVPLTLSEIKQSDQLKISPNLVIDASFSILDQAYWVNWQFSFNQHNWMKQLAVVVRERARLKSISSIKDWPSTNGYLKALKLSSEVFDAKRFGDHELKLLIADMPIATRVTGNQIESVIVLVDEQTLLRVSSPTYIMTQSFELLLYTLAMAMFIALFVCVWFIRPIEKKIANLLKSLDKQVKRPDEKTSHLNFENPIQNPKDEIDQISVKVAQMMQRMRQLSQDQQEMTRAVSHEFRTPIVKMGYHVELLQDFVAHDDFSIVGIKQNMKELHELVDELLLYSSLEQNMEMVFAQFDLKHAINKLLQQLQVISTCQLILEMDDNIVIKAHENYLIRALQNLITNAQRYGKNKIVIMVKQINRQVHIRVEDDGIGLTHAQKQSVFEPFKVIEQSRNKKLAGHGLGLAIVKRIVLLHGGKAFVDEPVRLSGASFVLVFPIRSF